MNTTPVDSGLMDSLKSRVAAAMHVRGLNQAELARRASMHGHPVSQQAVQQILSGRNATSKHIPALALALDVTMDWLTLGRGTGPSEKPSGITKKTSENVMELETVPVPSNIYSGQSWPRDLRVLGMAECGPDGWSLWNGEVIELTSRPPNLAGASNAYAVYVVGTSMSPRYEPGELAYIHPGKPAQIGDYVLIQVRPERGESTPRAVIKRLVKRSGSKLVLEQFSPPKTTEIRASEVISVHLVVGSGKP